MLGNELNKGVLVVVYLPLLLRCSHIVFGV